MRIFIIIILLFTLMYQSGQKGTIERQNETLKSRIEHLETQLDLKSIEMTMTKQAQSSKDTLFYKPE